MNLSCFQEFSLPLEEICRLLRGSNREVHELLLNCILLMTGDLHKSRLIYENDTLLNDLLDIASCNNGKIGQLSLDSIINISGSEEGALAILEARDSEHDVITLVLKFILDCDSSLADHGCKILANMSIHERVTYKISKIIIDDNSIFTQIADAVRNSRSYNRKGCRLEHLSQFIGNLGQSSEFQDHLLHVECDKFVSLFPIVYNGESSLERRGISALIYNCLFDSKNHPILLNEPFNVLSTILYSLAGPEEFEECEYESMPLELQYLPVNKRREVDPNIRKILLKSLLLICATKYGRTFLRECQSYLILREYHKWEEDTSNILACENVIDILIRTEEEIGIDDLKSLEVPEDLQDQFQKWDLDYVKNI